MKLHNVKQKEVWNALVKHQPFVPFHQSWEWGEFQVSQNNTVSRLAYEENGTLQIGATWIFHTLPFGKAYWYAPYGPLTTMMPSSPSYRALLRSYLEQVMHQADPRVIFLRLEPRVEQCYESQFVALQAALQFRQTNELQVQNTRILTLSRSEDELLADMHQKTRYNIRLAERKGVTVKVGKQYIEDFVRLNHETTKRDNFVSHPDAYYRSMIDSLPESMVRVYAAEYKKKIIAAHIIISFGDTTTYVHGASSSEDRNVMAPYALQWRQIQDAKKDGRTYYDFWGIAPSTRSFAKADRWAGITRFKNGFGGKEKNFVGAFDLPISTPWYSLYSIIRKVR